MLVPVSATAATVKTLEGEWESPVPDSVAAGDIVNAVWRFNVNDDGAAPSNTEIPNLTVVFLLENGEFQSIPELCLSEAVTPLSAISADGTMLTCNVGTQAEGTALRVTTPVVATGTEAGQGLTLSATSDGEEVELDPLPVVQTFGMDILWGGGANSASSTDRTFVYNWTVFQEVGSIAGPNQLEYTITVDSSVAGAWSNTPTCGQFEVGAVQGHPWSGGTHPSEQLAGSVDSCTITRVATTSSTGTATFHLQLSGIPYSGSQVPTTDSAGNALPQGLAAVASGQIRLTQTTAATAGSVEFTSDAPQYLATDGISTVTDDASNNTAGSTWAAGVWNNGWQTGYTGSTASQWANSYLVGVGSTVRQVTGLVLPNISDASSIQRAALCNVLDTKYVSFVGASSFGRTPASGSGSGVTFTPLEDLTSDVTTWYYVGTAALLDPASSSYNPNTWTGCGGTGSMWTTTLPSDLTTVRAVRVEFGLTAAVRQTRPVLFVDSTLKSTTQIGQDVWEWGSYAMTRDNDTFSSDEWSNPGRSTIADDVPAAGTLTPDLRYAFAAAGRDVLRTVGSTPVVSKTVSPASALPGDLVTYTLDYSADSHAAITDRDGFTLVDTLPVGLTYLAGSASPEPTITTVDGQQVLSWTIDDLPINQTRSLSYQVAVAGDAISGQTYLNTVTASVDGLSSSSSAVVRVSSNGLTRLAKESSLTQIPNPDGSGDGAAQWTVIITSADPRRQAFTDTIDVLPWSGDGRGTTMAGSYQLSGPVSAPAGATVYYTTQDPAEIALDPADESNGGAGGPVSDLWSTEYTADATAVRVIGGQLAPRATFEFTISYETTGMATGDILVNTAWARAADTQLDMRTSASVEVAPYWAMSLKKYVLTSATADPDQESAWADANDTADYPRYVAGESVQYKVCLTNTGTGVLTDIAVTDDLQPVKGGFTLDSLDPGATECAEPYSVVYDEADPSMIVNTASASTITPDGDLDADDPAGVYLTNHGVEVAKSADPADGSSVAPGSTVTYTISFTGTGSTESYVDYVDHLDGVLDDASLDLESLTSTSENLAGAFDETTGSIRVSGYIAPGEVSYFSYSVELNEVDSLGDGVLLNVVTPPGDTPGSECAVGDPLCTEHPIPTPTLVLKKDIVGRAAADDQFDLSIQHLGESEPVELGQTTTSGEELGVQSTAVVGPVRAAPQGHYRVAEVGAGDTDLDQYASTVSCTTAEGTAVSTTAVSETAGAWELDYPVPAADAAAPEVVTCVITNQPVQQIQVEKLGRNCDTDQPVCELAGAEFAIFDTDPSQAGATALQDGITPVADTPARFVSTALVLPGEYWLVETKAPEGFSLLAEPIRFSLTSEGIVLAEDNPAVAVSGDDSFTIQVTDATAAQLPKAGGSGLWPFLGAGALFILAAGGSLVVTGAPRPRRLW